MSNVLSEDKQQQVIALGRLGWSLRRIERETGIRRETASGYLRAAGIDLRQPGSWGRTPPQPAEKQNRPTVTTGSEAKPARGVTTGSEAKPVRGVTTEPELPRARPGPTFSSTCSACDPFREVIEGGLLKGRNAMAIWQDLAADYGFASGYQSVKRYVRRLRGQ